MSITARLEDAEVLRKAHYESLPDGEGHFVLHFGPIKRTALSSIFTNSAAQERCQY
jgi:hypothetical protein